MIGIWHIHEHRLEVVRSSIRLWLDVYIGHHKHQAIHDSIMLLDVWIVNAKSGMEIMFSEHLGPVMEDQPPFFMTQDTTFGRHA